jgi:hypothetical protein
LQAFSIDQKNSSSTTKMDAENYVEAATAHPSATPKDVGDTHVHWEIPIGWPYWLTFRVLQDVEINERGTASATKVDAQNYVEVETVRPTGTVNDVGAPALP